MTLLIDMRPEGVRWGLRGQEVVGEETTSFPEFCPTKGGHGVGGVRGGWYMNIGAQSLKKIVVVVVVVIGVVVVHVVVVGTRNIPLKFG